MRPADDAVGTAKTFLVSEILEVVLKLKKFNYLIYTTTYVFTSLLTKFHLFSNLFGTNIYNLRIV